MIPLPEKCVLCDKSLRYASSNKKAKKQELSQGSNTHDADAKSEAHFGHIGGKRSRSEFKSLKPSSWDKMGIKNPAFSQILCYECHEVVLHNPVFNESQVKDLAVLFKGKIFDEKVLILNQILKAGLNALLNGSR